MGKATTYIKWSNIYEWTEELMKDKKNVWTASLLFIGAHMTLRWSDLSKLKWKQVLSGQFKVTEGKTKKEKVITISEKPLAIMLQLFEVASARYGITGNAYIFRNKQGGIVSRTYANDMLRRMQVKFGSEHNISTHSLRKSAPRVLWDMNPSWETIIRLQAMLNHESPFTTIVYLGIRDTEIKDLYLSLPTN